MSAPTDESAFSDDHVALVEPTAASTTVVAPPSMTTTTTTTTTAATTSSLASALMGGLRRDRAVTSSTSEEEDEEEETDSDDDEEDTPHADEPTPARKVGPHADHTSRLPQQSTTVVHAAAAPPIPSGGEGPSLDDELGELLGGSHDNDENGEPPAATQSSCIEDAAADVPTAQDDDVTNNSGDTKQEEDPNEEATSAKQEEEDEANSSAKDATTLAKEAAVAAATAAAVNMKKSKLPVHDGMTERDCEEIRRVLRSRAGVRRLNMSPGLRAIVKKFQVQQAILEDLRRVWRDAAAINNRTLLDCGLLGKMVDVQLNFVNTSLEQYVQEYFKLQMMEQKQADEERRTGHMSSHMEFVVEGIRHDDVKVSIERGGDRSAAAMPSSSSEGAAKDLLESTDAVPSPNATTTAAVNSSNGPPSSSSSAPAGAMASSSSPLPTNSSSSSGWKPSLSMNANAKPFVPNANAAPFLPPPPPPPPGSMIGGLPPLLSPFHMNMNLTLAGMAPPNVPVAPVTPPQAASQGTAAGGASSTAQSATAAAATAAATAARRSQEAEQRAIRRQEEAEERKKKLVAEAKARAEAAAQPKKKQTDIDPTQTPVAYVEFKRSRIKKFPSVKVIEPGNYVIVTGDRGLDCGLLVQMTAPTRGGVSVMSMEGTKIDEAKIKWEQNAEIIRLAEPHEVEMLHEKIPELEKEALRSCRESCKAIGLGIELLDCEFQFDKKKISFYFFSEVSVDFRELVKELYRTYGARIWMENVNPHVRNAGVR